MNILHSSMNTGINSSIMSEDLSEPSSPESHDFDDSDLLHSTVHDDVTSQLAHAGPIGVAAAAAIATGKKRKRPHSFETNPSVRKRQRTRLLRKLRAIIDEYTTRVGQQAVVLCCTPGKTQQMHAFRVFGSQPLENVIRNHRQSVMGDLEAALAQQAPPQQPDNPLLHELPPLVIDGIPTPVDKMTQAQLRAFIPEMLKYSTGRSKPGWGKIECRPIWWPDDVPWANVRSDVRSEDQKKKVSWTHALRTIVRNCYKHHGRDDLMPEFLEEGPQHAVNAGGQYAHQTMVQTINNPDGTVSIIQIDTGDSGNPQIVTLADGTQAQVVHAFHPSQLNGHTVHEANQAVQTLAEVAANQQEAGMVHNSVSVEMNHDGTPHAIATLAEATLNQDGQIILTGDASSLEIGSEINLGQGDGQVKQIVGMVTIPVSMYQTVVTSIAQMNEVQAQQVHHTTSSPAIQVIAPAAVQEDNSGSGNQGESGDVPEPAMEVMTVEQT